METNNKHAIIKYAKEDLTILDDLLDRTNNLPEILHLRASEPGYEFTEDDKQLLLKTYSQLDDILKEVAAFINVKFPRCERHEHAWNEIDFDLKIGPFKVGASDRSLIKAEWNKGLFDFKSLIKTLRNEVALLVYMNEPHHQNRVEYPSNISPQENTTLQNSDSSLRIANTEKKDQFWKLPHG